MTVNIFNIKDLEKKESIVRFHYESSYRCTLKKDLTPLEVDFLYKELQKLKGCEFIYDKSK